MNNKAVNGALSRFGADRKKVIVASCLIAVMVIMWARVLTGKKNPQGASAATVGGISVLPAAGSVPELQISFIDLPKVTGRNDVLTRDFFAASDCEVFTNRPQGAGAGIEVVSTGGNEELIGFIQNQLRLTVVDLRDKPSAFVNGKLLFVGDKVVVGKETKTYECEVTRIDEKAVFVKCGDIEIGLKLVQTSEVED